MEWVYKFQAKKLNSGYTTTIEATPKSQKNAIATKTRRHQDSQSAYL
jgi:hypothetical protein